MSELPAFYVHFFTSIRFEADPEWISKYWLHLWFLGYLFAISAVCLPFLAWLRRPAGKNLVNDLVRIAGFRGGMFLFAAPLFLSQLILRPFFPAYQDWADVATYLFIFVMGAVIISDRRFEAAIRRDVRWFVAVGALAAAGAALILSSMHFDPSVLPHQPVGVQAAFALCWTLDVWMWNLAVLYVGIRWLNRPNRALDYAQESVLPFYVIHHPVVITLATFIVTWQLSLWPKFGILVVLAYGITLLIYEFGVRRWGPMRTIFGLGPRRKSPPPDSQPVVSSA